MQQLLRLLQRSITVSGIVQKAFVETDRANYVLPETRAWAYEDHPLEIGFGATISAPHMHVFVAEKLSNFVRRPNARFLDVGCGSGYLAGMFHRLNPACEIEAIDYIPELVEMSKKNFERDLGGSSSNNNNPPPLPM